MLRVATVVHPRIDPTQFLALQIAAGWRLAVELIDGEAVVTPPAGGHAASVQGELFFALRSWQERTADQGLLLQDAFVALPGGHYLAPDIAWWSAARRPPLSHGAIEGAPDLVIEVLSPATRANDLGIKRELYVSSGVREMWLADPDARAITRAHGRSGDEDVLGEGEVLRSELLEGFALDIARAFQAT
jgi:Uma2 family endonuclease